MLKPITFFLMMLTTTVHAQFSVDNKIKVILLGTFHYGFTNDQHKTPFNDLFSVKRQKELNVLNSLLAAQHPTQIMVENEPSQQRKWDSIFANVKDADTSIRNEIFQIGIKTARKARLTSVTCVDFQQELLYDSLEAYDKRHPEDSVSQYPIFNAKIKNEFAKVALKDVGLKEYYRYLNSPAVMKNSMLDYMQYVLAYGKGNDYTGNSFTIGWYERNLKIYTNILRSIKPNDKVILVIFGSAHIPVLKHYFDNNPLFEVVDLDKLLK